MILLKIDVDEALDAQTVPQIYAAFGIGNEPENDISWKDQAIFGDRADVRNIFCTQRTFDDISDNIKKSALVGKNGRTDTMDFNETKLSWDWAMYSPTCGGPRYEAMLEELHANTGFLDLPDGVIAILTPDDPTYEPSPRSL